MCTSSSKKDILLPQKKKPQNLIKVLWVMCHLPVQVESMILQTTTKRLMIYSIPSYTYNDGAGTGKPQ